MEFSTKGKIKKIVKLSGIFHQEGGRSTGVIFHLIFFNSGYAILDTLCSLINWLRKGLNKKWFLSLLWPPPRPLFENFFEKKMIFPLWKVKTLTKIFKKGKKYTATHYFDWLTGMLASCAQCWWPTRDVGCPPTMTSSHHKQSPS